MWRLAVALILGALPAKGEPAILAAWEAWRGDRIGQIAIWQDGAIRYQSSDAKPAALASVSKMLTGLCIGSLVRRGTLSVAAPISEYLPADALPSEAQGITIAQLLTHSAGLAPDATQDLKAGEWSGEAPLHENVARTALHRPLKSPGTHRYNNENYAVLGWIVERVTNQPFVDVCDWAAWRSVGAEVLVAPQWGMAGAFGGLAATPGDVARATAAFVAMGPEYLARVPVTQDVIYGPGLLSRQLPEGRVYWHAGQLCLRRLLSLRGDGAYVAAYPSGLVVAVVWGGCASDRALRDLDRALAEAALGR